MDRLPFPALRSSAGRGLPGAPLFVLVGLLFTAPCFAAEPKLSPASPIPTPTPTAVAPAIAPAPASHSLPLSPANEVMMAFGFLGLVLFSASAGNLGRRRPFEVQYRRFPYGSFRERRSEGK